MTDERKERPLEGLSVAEKGALANARWSPILSAYFVRLSVSRGVRASLIEKGMVGRRAPYSLLTAKGELARAQAKRTQP